MILSTQLFSEDRALFRLGADILVLLDQPQTVSHLWILVRGKQKKQGITEVLSFDRFLFGLSLLCALNLIGFLRGTLKLKINHREGILNRLSSLKRNKNAEEFFQSVHLDQLYQELGIALRETTLRHFQKGRAREHASIEKRGFHLQNELRGMNLKLGSSISMPLPSLLNQEIPVLFKRSLDTLEAAFILKLFQLSKGNVRAVEKYTKLSRSSLYSKIRKYKINPRLFREKT